MRTATLYEAKCAQCTKIFAHASFGDFAYGEATLSTVDGQHFVHADAFAEFAQRVSAMIPEDGQHTIWPFLAALADPIDGTGLTHRIVCPHCTSSDLAHWGGNAMGPTTIAAATYQRSEQLDTRMLARRVAEILEGLS